MTGRTTHAVRMGGSGLATALLASFASLGHASDEGYLLRSADVIHESFFIATPEWRGLGHRGSWTEFKARVNDNWSATITNLQLRDRNLLDETYVEYENGPALIRAGKMRSVFGQSRWSDLFYNVVSRYPIIRMMPLMDRYSLLTFNSGAEVHFSAKGWDFGAQTGDASLTDRQFLPKSQNVLQGRISRMVGDSLIGLSALRVDPGSFGSGGTLYGADYRWIANHVQVRAELVGSRRAALNSRGYFADLSYRVPGNHHTEVGVRLEGYAMGSTTAKLMTAGIRYVPLPQLTLNLNYGWEPDFGGLPSDSGKPPAPFQRGYANSLKGWSFQTMLAFRFHS